MEEKRWGASGMVAHVATVAFLGLEARAVEVQVQIAAGLPKFLVVGLPDKAVGESRERVHAALAAIGLSLPPKRITVNLAPADLPKEGSHYDLPIALGLLAAMGAIDRETLLGFYRKWYRPDLMAVVAVGDFDSNYLHLRENEPALAH